MALLLRMGGVPARVATGFSPGGFSKRRDAWIVRDTDAHAWVEAWYDELGWVTYDPTPDLTPARSQIAALEAPAATAATPGVESDPAAGGGASGGRRLRRPATRPAAGPAAQQPGRRIGRPRRTAASRGGCGRSWRRRLVAGAVAFVHVRAPPRTRPAVAARPRGRRAGGRAPPRRSPAADRHDPAPARAAPRRLTGRRCLPARHQRLALRPGSAPADSGRAPGIPRARSPRDSATPGGYARSGRCRPAPASAQVSAARRASWRISARIRSRRGSDERST